MTDWREVCKLYIDHVGFCEGVDFLADSTNDKAWEYYTTKGLGPLRELIREHEQEGKRRPPRVAS